MSAVDRVISRLREVGCHPRGGGKGKWSSHCPAHEDAKASLSIAEGDDGRVLLTCHAGCDVKSIVAALGLAMRELFPAASGTRKRVRDAAAAAIQGASRRREQPVRKIVYVILDELGNRIEHVRREYADGSKDFVWRRNGQTGLGGLKVASLPLYGVKALESLPEGSKVVVVEGEKTAAALHRVGIPALGTVTGAEGTPSDDVLKALLDYEVLVWPDNDPDDKKASRAFVGQKHMDRIAARLLAMGSGPKLICWEGAPAHGDAADFLSNRGTREGVEALMAAAKSYGDGAKATPERAGPPEGRSGGADRGTELPQIQVTADMSDVVSKAEAALLASKSVEIYQRLGALVRIVRDGARSMTALQRSPRPPGIEPLPEANLRELLSRSAYWQRVEQDGETYQVLPPTWAVSALAERGTWTFRYLEAVTESPALRGDGTILDRPGYDELSGLLYEPNAEYPPIPEVPSNDAIKKAIEVLLEPFSEFCYSVESDRAATLAAILSLIGRHAIRGPIPMFAVLAHAPGSGKGLLVSACSLIGTGRPPTLMSPTHDREELRKVVTTLAMEGHRAVLFDNAEGKFGSPVLAAALTATEWTGRILGYSRSVTAPLHAVWFVTGNNLAFVGDTPRRIVPILLDAKVERPEDRVFRYPDLHSHIAERRPLLYSAGLTLLRGFVLAGRPAHGGPRIGSFEAWDDLVRSAVIWLLGVDPCAGRARIREEDDTDRGLARALFTAWADAYPGGAGATLRDAIQKAESVEPLRRALAALDPRGDGTRLDSRAIGYVLRKLRGRIVGGLRLKQAGDANEGALWCVVPLDARSRGGGDEGDGGDTSGHSGNTGDGAHSDHAHETRTSREPEMEKWGNDHPHHRHHHQTDPSEEGGPPGGPDSNVDRIIEEEL